jgi:hypothetical protein
MNQLKTLIGRIASGERWQLKTRQAKQIQTALDDSLPPELTHACEAWLADTETLVISCPSGMYASKLRHLTPGILLKLRAAGVEVRAIRVEVQAGRARSNIVNVKQVTDKPPESILVQMEQLGSQLTDAPLSRALKKLADTLRQK